MQRSSLAMQENWPEQTKQSLAFYTSTLFQHIQKAGVFSDSKTFADAVPKISYQHACEAYNRETPANLPEFVEQHFYLPDEVQLQTLDTLTTVSEYIDQLWPLLSRKKDTSSQDSLLPLANSYIVPGGRFREIYYWDSYFTALGLVNSNQEYLAKSMMDNFVQMQQQYGHIPNGNRSYYLGRSQPPVLALLGQLLVDNTADDNTKLSIIRQYLPALESEYNFWMSGLDIDKGIVNARCVLMPNGEVLNRYWDENCLPRPESHREDQELAEKLADNQRADFYRNIRAACESGWDFSSRWLEDPEDLLTVRTTEIIPVDLNCLLYLLEKTIAAWSKSSGKSEQSAHYQTLADSRKKAINDYLWSEQQGCYFDYHFPAECQTDIFSLAAVCPLFTEIASDHQAAQVTKTLAKYFLAPGGLRTTLTTSDQQWDAPNGWAPLHWFAIKGLMQYNQVQLAKNIANCWQKTIESYFDKNGSLMEKYDVENLVTAAAGGEYQVQQGFGWTNGVYSALQAINWKASV